MVLVLLPGLDGTGMLFEPLLEALPSHIKTKVVRYSSELSQSYAELEKYVITELPDEDYILLGESFSGRIAYNIASRNPENLVSVIFVASFIDSPCKILNILLSVAPLKILLRKRVPNVVAKWLLGRKIEKDKIELLRNALSSVRPEVLKYRIKAVCGMSPPTVSCESKAIYILPTNDYLVPKGAERKIKTMCKKMRTHTVSGTHFILQSNPEACAKIIANETAL